MSTRCSFSGKPAWSPPIAIRTRPSVLTGTRPIGGFSDLPPELSHVTGTVRRVDPQPQTPRVTASMLRRADEMCRRRLRREHTGDKRSANASASARFAVSNRVSADARLAHAELGPPSADAFVDPRALEPEQRALYRAAVQGYLGEFGDRPGRRSEEHTSELQSRRDLVCRLLLEKKK